jgi:hypothetical protein
VATTPSLKVVKSFTYRGSPRLFSNRYHFNGGTPADSAHWTTLSDAVVTAEKAIYPITNGCTIVATYGYAAGSDVPVFSKTYSTTSTGSFTAVAYSPGDVAFLVRYATAARTAKNHPVYLFNYYHCACWQSGGSPDVMNNAQNAAAATYAAAWISGFSDGTNTLHRAGPNGASATGQLVEAFLTHRDLPR